MFYFCLFHFKVLGNPLLKTDRVNTHVEVYINNRKVCMWGHTILAAHLRKSIYNTSVRSLLHLFLLIVQKFLSFEVQKQSVSNAFQYVVHYLSQIVMWQANGNVATKLQRFFEFHPYLLAKFPPFPPTKSEGAIRGVSPSVSYIIINLPYREKQNYNLTVLQLLFLIPCLLLKFRK